MSDTLMLPQLEAYEQHYRRIVQDGLPDALTAIAAFWAAPPAPLVADPMELPEIASWPEAPIPPEALLDYVDTYPAVAVEATSLSDDGVSATLDAVFVHVYVADADPVVCHKLVHRYLAAIGEVVFPTPRGIGVKERAKLSLVADEAISPSSDLYLKSGTVRVPLHIVGVL